MKMSITFSSETTNCAREICMCVSNYVTRGLVMVTTTTCYYSLKSKILSFDKGKVQI